MNTFQLRLDDQMNNEKEILVLNVYDFPLLPNLTRERIEFLYVMINNTIMKYENKEKHYIYVETLIKKKPWVEKKVSLSI